MRTTILTCLLIAVPAIALGDANFEHDDEGTAWLAYYEPGNGLIRSSTGDDVADDDQLLQDFLALYYETYGLTDQSDTLTLEHRMSKVPLGLDGDELDQDMEIDEREIPPEVYRTIKYNQVCNNILIKDRGIKLSVIDDELFAVVGNFKSLSGFENEYDALVASAVYNLEDALVAAESVCSGQVDALSSRSTLSEESNDIYFEFLCHDGATADAGPTTIHVSAISLATNRFTEEVDHPLRYLTRIEKTARRPHSPWTGGALGLDKWLDFGDAENSSPFDFDGTYRAVDGAASGCERSMA